MSKKIFGKLITKENPKSPIAESYRTLRTNIQFSSLDNEIKVLHITSAGPGEGKSTTAANLAVAMCQAGKKVIILDCDLRRPSQHKIFKLQNIRGLSNLLVENLELQEEVQETDIEYLSVLTTGPIPPNPAELVGSNKMKSFVNELKENSDFDLIIIDSPPVLSIADALLLSSFADATMLVIKAGETTKEMVVDAKESLLNVKSNIIGTVLNQIEKNGSSYYYYYYYGEGDTRKKKNRHKNKKIFR
jgi:capsular exopolysaccharide synthesis family protein